MKIRNSDAIADEVLLLDGPYSPEAMRTASELISELVRRMNHATLSWNAAQALPMPQDVDAVVSWLSGAMGGLPQLLGQLGQRLGALGADPRLEADRPHNGPARSGAETAGMAAQYLATASQHTGAAMDALGGARKYTGRLAMGD